MEAANIIIVICILVLVVILFVLSQKEMQKSLRQTRASEKLLEDEKASLMRTIEEQGEKIKKNRIERMNELAKVAEFGRLSQGLFHDLMTPLNSIIIHTEKLKSVPQGELDATHKSIEKAIDASRRMGAYIQNIRSNMQGDHHESTCTMGDELESVISLFSFALKTENIKIKKEIREKIVWHGDSIKLRQVFSNLISNAIDSFEDTNRDNRDVKIELKKEKGEVLLNISDTGKGIPHEIISRIFDPFFTTKSPDKGTGIGLATVKGIIERDFKGTIEVKSELGKGTAFSVRFPLKK